MTMVFYIVGNEIYFENSNGRLELSHTSLSDFQKPKELSRSKPNKFKISKK